MKNDQNFNQNFDQCDNIANNIFMNDNPKDIQNNSV